MKKYLSIFPLAFLFCNLHAIRFISVIDGTQKEAPDRITVKNDLDEKVDIEAKVFLLDGCFPLKESIAGKKDHCFEGVDAYGLYSVKIKLAAGHPEYMVILPEAESIVRSLESHDTVEYIFKISEVIATHMQGKKEISYETLRSKKCEIKK